MPRTTTILFILAALLAPTSRTAFGRQEHDNYAERLAEVHVFALGSFGLHGGRSPAERVYDEIMSRPSRLEIFETVLETGTPEARSYALVGISNLNRKRFSTLATTLRSSKVAVNVGLGCVIGTVTLGTVVKNIEARQYVHYL